MFPSRRIRQPSRTTLHQIPWLFHSTACYIHKNLCGIDKPVSAFYPTTARFRHTNFPLLLFYPRVACIYKYTLLSLSAHIRMELLISLSISKDPKRCGFVAKDSKRCGFVAMELIPYLPEEIGLECLLRVPYKAHCKLKSVCRKWESMVNSPRFYQDRKSAGTSELCICAVVAVPQGNFVEDKRQRAPAYALSLYDPQLGLWERLPSIPQFPEGLPLFCRCVCVNQNLVLIGGWHPSHWEAMRSVFVYDFSSGKWRQGTDMPTIRSFFACSVSSDGLVYVAGGHDDNKNALRAAEVYSVEEDTWRILPPLSQERDECHGVHVDGKFYVISGYTTESQGRFERSAEFFDPNTGVWSRVENMWSLGGCPRSCVVANGSLYFFHKQEVFQYNTKENVWGLVDSVPEIVNSTTCATVWRDKIFVSGCACSGGDQACYMFDLSAAKTKGEERSSKRWIKVHRPQNFSGFLQSAATVEI